MAYSRFQTAAFLRLAGLAATLMALAWAVGHTDWYVCMLLLALATVAQAVALVRFAGRSSREVARFLDAIAFDDTSASFQGLSREGPFAELGAAMARVLDRLRTGRAEREEQTQYLQTLLAHVPVALISLEDHGAVQLLNLAGRRLFESACTDTAQFSRHGAAFAAGMETLKPGESVILRMERKVGPLQLKAAATDVAVGGARRRLVSLRSRAVNVAREPKGALRALAHTLLHALRVPSRVVAKL